MKQNFRSWKIREEKQIEDFILFEITEEKTTFTELLKKCKEHRSTLSRVTLTKHLKNLIRKNFVEKTYNSKKDQVVYSPLDKGIVKIQIESMIWNLGKTATHYIVRKKLKKPIDVHYDILYEIDQYMKTEPKSVSWKQLFDFLEDNYPVVI